MRYFISDYSQGAHPDVLKALVETNFEHTDGYGLDVYCDNAASIIKSLIGKPDANIHFLVGGTPANVITIAATLKPYECVIAPHTSHIYMHETGAVEATGHKIYALDTEDGKLRPDMIQCVLDEFEDEHMTLPKLVYISNTTELGTIYKKSELEALSKFCKEKGLYLYLDGARLGSALTSPENDISIKDIANLVDAFYIGGTKNGTLFGEALIVLNDEINDHFRFYIKQNLGMLAKGRLLGVQFEALLKGGENSLLFKIAAHENNLAEKLRNGISDLGYEFLSESCTNQIFPILPKEKIAKLREEFLFEDWSSVDDPSKFAVRFVTGWGTTDDDINALLEALK
ncbi:MAG: aminotransferase class I/II-fold pyridoxal phosphate-dependent enzyme [Clostridiales bacterium]|nr:aminotransferase class I/II-fold pyridoxal phosphate-dependent enzyme [Clostridiales bacterium]